MKEVDRYLLVDFSDFMNLSLRLCALLLAEHKKEPFDYLLSVQRGGAVMSKILSDILNVPIATVTLSSYNNLGKTKEPKVTQEVSVNITDRKILVLDEISDTGETLHVLEKYLSAMQPRQLKTATLFVKPHTTFTPDYHVMNTDKWIIFPYELREMCDFIEKKYSDNHELVHEIHDYFKRNGVSDELVSVISN